MYKQKIILYLLSGLLVVGPVMVSFADEVTETQFGVSQIGTSVVNGNPVTNYGIVASEGEDVQYSSRMQFFTDRSNIGNEDINVPLQITVFDIGQGKCSLIRYQNHYGLIDAGTDDKTSGHKFYKDKLGKTIPLGISSLDFVIITHPHDDHFNGMSMILGQSGLNIDSVFIPNVISGEKETAIDVTDTIGNPVDIGESSEEGIMQSQIQNTIYRDEKTGLRSVHERKKFKIKKVKAGFKIKLGDGSATLKIVAPTDRKIFTKYQGNDRVNAVSIVSVLEYGNFKMLFAGDANDSVEHDLIENNSRESLRCNVLEAGHHGSKTSSCNEFISFINPEYAIMSFGKGNTHNHPAPDTINRFIDQNVKYLCTAYNGDIDIYVKGQDNPDFSNDSFRKIATTLSKKQEHPTYSLKTVYAIDNKDSAFHFLPGCTNLNKAALLKQDIRSVNTGEPLFLCSLCAKNKGIVSIEIVKNINRNIANCNAFNKKDTLCKCQNIQEILVNISNVRNGVPIKVGDILITKENGLEVAGDDIANILISSKYNKTEKKSYAIHYGFCKDSNKCKIANPNNTVEFIKNNVKRAPCKTCLHKQDINKIFLVKELGKNEIDCVIVDGTSNVITLPSADLKNFDISEGDIIIQYCDGSFGLLKD